MVDIFQGKIGHIFKELPSMFGIVDDILAVGYDDNDTDHDKTKSIDQDTCLIHKRNPKHSLD